MKQSLSPKRIKIHLLLLIPLQLSLGITEYTVTVGDKTGGGFAYKLNSVEAPALTFKLGETHKFNLDGITTAGHPFIFSTDAGGGGSTNGEFTTNVSNSQATSGFVQITVTVGMPSTLYYYCAAHGGMGGAITVIGTTDTDSDGIPDDWENDHGLDANSDDASLDPDEDGATNLLEFLSGGNPQLANSFSADSDNDGLSDALESANGLDPSAETSLNDALVALFDPDEDGLTTALEDTLGLDPSVSDSNTSLGQAAIDPDGDGFTSDLENSIEGLDPSNINTNLELANLIVAPDTDEDGFSDALEISLDLDEEATTDKETFAKAVLDEDRDGIIILGLDSSTSPEVLSFARETIDPDQDGITTEKEEELNTDPDTATDLNEIAVALIDPDNDGFTSALEGANNLDANNADSLENFTKTIADKDNDGLLDIWEDESNIFSSTTLNTFIIDSDDDGLSDSLEQVHGSDPSVADLASEFALMLIDPDGDGITTDFENSYEELDPLTKNLITDLDGLDFENDPDGDGFTSNLEFTLGLDPNSANSIEELAKQIIDPDSDGFTTSFESENKLNPNSADPLDSVLRTLADKDEDGLLDSWENESGIFKSTTTETFAIDTDDDGLSDPLEEKIGSNPSVKDLNNFAKIIIDPDGDGLTSTFEDSYEALDPHAADSSQKLAGLEIDPDNDGFTTDFENKNNLNPNSTDTLESVFSTLGDKDGDGLLDRWEDETEFFTSTTANTFAIDTDSDGLSDPLEEKIGSDSRMVDVNEFAELVVDPDLDGLTTNFENSYEVLDPFTRNLISDLNNHDLENDADGDGLTDNLEVSLGLDRNAANSIEELAKNTIDRDNDGFTSEFENQNNLNPNSTDLLESVLNALGDKDGDGLLDHWEHSSNLFSPDTKEIFVIDSDEDGLSDSLEEENGSDPQEKNLAMDFAELVVDSDGDGFTNEFEESNPRLDPIHNNQVEDLIGGVGNETPGSRGNSPVVEGWYYTDKMGWLFTNSTVYPYVYREKSSNQTGEWLYFETTSTQVLWFYNFSTNNWESH